MKEKMIFALGFFDGVHLGHQALLAQCRRLADERGCKAAALTFDLPPSAILQNQKPNMLLTVQDRCALLRQYGMDSICVYPATAESLALPWHDFLDKLMDMDAVGFVCGDDFRFGRNGEGTPQRLKAFAAERDLPCVILPLEQMDGEKISSSRIRSVLERGNIEQANRLMGHPHLLSGTVIAGRQLGRTLGIPTANLPLPDELLTPALGVYACYAWVDNRKYLAVTNIGNRPTVGGEHTTVESWLFDFEGDLYGKTLTLEFHAFLRPEKKFPNLQALQAEIQRNRQKTIDFFAKK